MKYGIQWVLCGTVGLASFASAEVEQSATPDTLTITQKLDRDTAALRVGDALRRTVEVRASEVEAARIPATAFTAPDGVEVSVGAPLLEDVVESADGFVGGRRIQQASYSFQRPGAYTLPALDVGWFDPIQQRERTAHAPAIGVTVAARGAASVDAKLPTPPTVPPREDWIDWAIAAATIAVLAIVGWLIGRAARGARAWNAARVRARADSESAQFDALLRTLRSDDPLQSYRALHAWTRRTHGIGLATWCIDVNDSELTRQVAILERILFTKVPVSRWRAGALTRALQRVRRVAPRRSRSRSVLPPMDPPAHDLHE